MAEEQDHRYVGLYRDHPLIYTGTLAMTQEAVWGLIRLHRLDYVGLENESQEYLESCGYSVKKVPYTRHRKRYQ